MGEGRTQERGKEEERAGRAKGMKGRERKGRGSEEGREASISTNAGELPYIQGHLLGLKNLLCATCI